MFSRYFLWYLVSVNVISIIVFFIDFNLFIKRRKGIRPKWLCNLLIIIGGSFGALLIELICDPKITKQNAQSRVYTIAWLIIHTAVVFALYGSNHELVLQNTRLFYNQHTLLVWYFIAVNLTTFVVFIIDKYKAVHGEWRVREIVLLGMACAGGAAGALLAMDLFNHKVNSNHFMIGVPLLLCAHLAILVIIMLEVV